MPLVVRHHVETAPGRPHRRHPLLLGQLGLHPLIRSLQDTMCSAADQPQPRFVFFLQGNGFYPDHIQPQGIDRPAKPGAREDRAGIVVFGRDASIEIPPFDDDIPALRRLESLRGRSDATNLESALNLAQASMPEDTARRIVIVTDGNENLGQARKLARSFCCCSSSVC